MKVTYSYSVQRCLVLAAAIIVLSLHIVALASAQQRGTTPVIHWSISDTDNAHSAARYREIREQIRSVVSTEFRGSTWAIQQRHSLSDYLAIQLDNNQTPQHISLLMRISDMYVLGFTINDRTYLVSDADASPFNNVHRLGFSSEYATLLQRGNIESLSRLPLSVGTISVAAHNAVHDQEQATFTRSAARLLLLGALMLGEGTRFDPSIGTAISNAIAQGRPYNFTLSDEELIRNWGSLSGWARRISQNPAAQPFRNPGHIAWPDSRGRTSVRDLHSFNDLLALVGVLAAIKEGAAP